MGKIVDFESAKQVREQSMPNHIKFPTKEDVCELCENYEYLKAMDAIIGVDAWAGECWRELFEGIVMQNAMNYNEDPWDVFAAFIHNLFFEEIY